jgi:ABC-type transport system involved in cytochrome c biogenesis permease component
MGRELHPARGVTPFWGVAWAIFRKDLTSELRARYALWGTATFAVATLAVVSMAVGPFGGQAPLLAAFLWTVLLFSASAGLAQAFGREVERKTWLTLRLVAPPGPLLLGKWGVNLALLVATELLVVPLFLALFGVEPKSPAGFVAVLALATIGLSAAVTWVAALVAQARSHAALVAALAFPLVVPVVKTAIEGTRRALLEPGFASVELRVLASYAGAIVVAGFLLAEHVLDD